MSLSRLHEAREWLLVVGCHFPSRSSLFCYEKIFFKNCKYYFIAVSLWQFSIVTNSMQFLETFNL